MSRVIDIDKWERKSHYAWFSSFANPMVALDVKMDITDLLDYCNREGLSSYAMIMYVVCECINANAAMRLRILNEKVIEIDYANVAYTILVNERCFVNCRARTHLGLATYLEDVEANRKRYTNSNYLQEKYNDTTIVEDIYCSCLPWLSFASVVQPIPDNNTESKSIPRVCWCKYYTENARTYTTLNITVNHALVDGIDLSDVYKDIQWAFDHMDAYLENKR